MEVERLDALLLGIWANARSGIPEYVDRALKIIARRAALLGLDAPKQSNVRVGISHEEWLDEIE